MTTDMFDEDLILGYVEDTLSPEQKAAFEKTMQADPRLVELVTSMKQDHDLLGQLDQVTAPMELGDYVSAQLQREMLLGPLPQRRQATHARRSTPQSRSQSRMMRIWAYGSLAAMFLVVIGLMYEHIGHQSLIERAQQITFGKNAKDQPTVAMKPQSETAPELDNVIPEVDHMPRKLAAPTLGRDRVAADKQADDAYLKLDESTAAAPAPTAAPVVSAPMAMNAPAVASQPAAEAALPQVKALMMRRTAPQALADAREREAQRTPQSRTQQLKTMSPTTAMLSSDALTQQTDEGNRMSAGTTQPMDLATHGRQSFARGLGSTQPTNGSVNKQQAPTQQQQSVCIIQSQQPLTTVHQITQWAVRNRIQIVEQAPTALAQTSNNNEPSKADADALKKDKVDAKAQQVPPRQVITLNMSSSQVPVLINWLNSQKLQQNKWIAPLPQSQTPNQRLQQLQQELPLSPTLPLVQPDAVMQVQLMVVPEPKPEPSKADQKTKP